MEVITIGGRREVCWDEALIESADGIRVERHKPEYRGVAFRGDAPWEGAHCGYWQIVNDGRILRLYYRGCGGGVDEDGQEVGSSGNWDNTGNWWCYAESRDGKTFERIPLGIKELPGHPENNIFFPVPHDNVHICLDTNRGCPKEERFKALVGTHEQTLEYWKSEDGLHFTFERILVDDGAYDSMNVTFWDENSKQYFLFYRGLHGESTKDGKWVGERTGIAYHNTGVIRDVRVRTSKDFVTWSAPRMLDFGEDAPDYELYTNQVQPYFRAKHMMFGLPMRYNDRWHEEANYPYLPAWGRRRQMMLRSGREGSAITEAVIMTSRDGFHFRRTDEALITPEMEDGYNWFYGSSGPALGYAVTKNDRPGMADEISIYTSRKYRLDDVELCRYVVRMDGFFSWRADFKGGHLLTRPVIFEGGELYINFATSAYGHVRFFLCDEEGTILEGFDSGTIFGDSTRRKVDFAGDLSKLSGRPVRILIEMKDADLYSFRFEPKLNLAGQTGRWMRE